MSGSPLGAVVAALAWVVCGGCSHQEAPFAALLGQSVSAAREACREAGGVLRQAERPALRAIDVDHDGRQEYLFRLDATVECEGAESLFHCGSLGCPMVLYQQVAGRWREIGFLDGDERARIETVPAPAAGGHGDLYLKCPAGRMCDEEAHYRWTGETYELSSLQVRGFRVEVAGAPHGLRTLQHNAELRAVPSRSAEPIAQYERGTEVAIRGAVPGWYYVSPCNACANGFIEQGATAAR